MTRTTRTTRTTWLTRLTRLLSVLAVILGLARAAWAAPERVLAIYLPGVYFAQLERKLDLGSELATHLHKKLGDKYHLSARVYVSADAMEADAGRIAMILTESPYVAANLQKLLPLAAAGSGSDTRLLVLATAAVRSLTDLRRGGLVYASPVEPPQAFLEHFVFEGELAIGKDMLQSARDVASALSLLSVQKAQAVLLYEDNLASVRATNLRTLYRSELLPRPTVVLPGRAADPAEQQKLREALASFRGQVHPDLQTFHAVTDAPYQKLRDRMQQKSRRLPKLLELTDEPPPLPMPRGNLPSPVQVPLKAFTPAE